MVLETTGGERNGGRATGYESKAGVSGVNSGGYNKGHSSTIDTGRGMGTSGVTGDRGYTSTTTRGTSGGYDRGYNSITSNIPTSTVSPEHVSSSGIKESNTNVESCMTGSGSGTGKGTNTGSRSYTIGEGPSITRSRDYAVGGDSNSRVGDRTTSATTGGIGTSRTGAGPSDTGTHSGTGEGPSAARSSVDSAGSRLSFLGETAASLGLSHELRPGCVTRAGEQDHTTRDTSTGTTDESTLESIKNKAKDVAASVGIGAGAGTDTGPRAHDKGEDTSTGGTLSHIKDTASRIGLGSSAGTGGGNDKGENTSAGTRTYTIGGESYTTDKSRGYDVGSGIGFGSGNTYGQSSQGYTTADDTAALKGAGSVSYRAGAYLSGHGDESVERVGKGLERHTIMHPGQATNRDREEKARVEERVNREKAEGERVERERVERERAERERVERERADRERMDRERMDRERGQGGVGGERHVNNRSISLPRSKSGRKETEAGKMEQKMERDREQSSREAAGERYTIGHGRSIGDGGSDRTRRDEARRMEQGGQPREDAPPKHNRVRLDLEQELRDTEREALRIAKGKGIEKPADVTSPAQKYSSLVNEGPESTERKRGREDMARISSRDVTPTGRQVHIPGEFDTQEDLHDNAPEKLTRALEPTPLNREQQQQQEAREREVEKAARESSMERHRTADLDRVGTGPGGMRTTMRDSPEYIGQKGDTREEESRFEDDDDDYSTRRSILGRAADKMGNLLKT